MTTTPPAGPLGAVPGRQTWRPAAASRFLLALIVVVLLANSLPIALLPVYQDELGLLPVGLAAVAAGPTLGVLVALVVGARLPDALGRRPVLLLGAGLAAGGVVALLLADGLGSLLVGRAVVGAGVGLVSAAGTAALLDLSSPERRHAAAVSAAAAAVGGIAAGPALGGLVVQHLPAPLRTVLVLELVLLLPAVALLRRLPESVPAAGRVVLRTALRPRLPRTPERLRPVARLAAVAVVPAWAVMGLVLASGPGLLTRSLGVEDRSLVAAVLALFLGTSAVAQLGLRAWSVRRAAVAGAALLVGGLLGLVAALGLRSVPAYALALAVLGAGHGLSQVSAQSALGAAATPSERGPAFGALLVVTYLTAGATSLAAGYASQAFALVPAAIAAAALAAVAASAALVAAARTSRLPDGPCGPTAVPCP
ncbi:MAG TPA: MFS transporter [Geodermatophilus sp.]|nr:MFS transporter [Geodermatophilus sp.]